LRHFRFLSNYGMDYDRIRGDGNNYLVLILR
jgi:hypothetical protein